MGQLERYGLYVLCLVIFLILGVAIWGSGPDQKLTIKDGKVAENQEHRLKTEEDHANELAGFMRAKASRTAQKQREAEELFAAVDKGDLLGTAPVRPQRGANATVAKPPIENAALDLRTHKVVDGDNLEAIALRYLGKRHLWDRILAINPEVSERRLKIGTILKIPSRATVKAVNASHGARTYTVRKGDSPWRIASKHFGRKNADKFAAEILRLNRIADPRDIKEGTVLQLPTN